MPETWSTEKDRRIIATIFEEGDVDWAEMRVEYQQQQHKLFGTLRRTDLPDLEQEAPLIPHHDPA